MSRELDAAQLTRFWSTFAKVPGGKTLFSKALGLAVPYTGTIGASVEEIRHGYARVVMNDRRQVRNHLDSVHAIALVNLAELTGNLALIPSLPDGARVIISGISIEYLKKARGRVTATAEAIVPTTTKRQELEITVRLENSARELVAQAKLRCLSGPNKSKAASVRT